MHPAAKAIMFFCCNHVSFLATIGNEICCHDGGHVLRPALGATTGGDGDDDVLLQPCTVEATTTSCRSYNHGKMELFGKAGTGDERRREGGRVCFRVSPDRTHTVAGAETSRVAGLLGGGGRGDFFALIDPVEGSRRKEKSTSRDQTVQNERI